MSEQANNTDREIWREREGDYYADSIHVTEGGGIGIDCGGRVIVKPAREWHRLAATPAQDVPRGDEIEMREQIASLLSEYFPGKQWYRDLAAKAMVERFPHLLAPADILPPGARAPGYRPGATYADGYRKGQESMAQGSASQTELGQDLKKAVAHHRSCAPAQLRAAHAAISDLLFGHLDLVVNALLASPSPAAAPTQGADANFPSDEFINTFLKAEGSFAEAHEAPRESGVAIDSDISQDDADAFNAEARNRFRSSWQAAASRSPAATSEEETVQRVKEACAQVADRFASRKSSLLIDGVPSPHQMACAIAKAIRALIPAPAECRPQVSERELHDFIADDARGPLARAILQKFDVRPK